jgi:hypothetical protein
MRVKVEPRGKRGRRMPVKVVWMKNVRVQMKGGFQMKGGLGRLRRGVITVAKDAMAFPKMCILVFEKHLLHSSTRQNES